MLTYTLRRDQKLDAIINLPRMLYTLSTLLGAFLAIKDMADLEGATPLTEMPQCKVLTRR